MKRREAQSFNEINITPLTDIFLVLLIIMMVIAPMLDQQGLKLTVPENVEAQSVQDKDYKILSVMVDENDNYYIGETIVPVENLAQTIKSNVEKYPDGLMIKAQSNSSHGAIVKVMDSARNAGFGAISIEEI